MPVRTELFAAVTDIASPGAKPVPVGLPGSPVLEDMLLILVIGLALAAVLVLSVYVRYQRKRRPGLGRTASIAPGADNSSDGNSGRGARADRRRRNRRNPTLAETGGLPPVRNREPSPPAA